MTRLSLILKVLAVLAAFSMASCCTFLPTLRYGSGPDAPVRIEDAKFRTNGTATATAPGKSPVHGDNNNTYILNPDAPVTMGPAVRHPDSGAAAKAETSARLTANPHAGGPRLSQTLMFSQTLGGVNGPEGSGGHGIAELNASAKLVLPQNRCWNVSISGTTSTNGMNDADNKDELPKPILLVLENQDNNKKSSVELSRAPSGSGSIQEKLPPGTYILSISGAPAIRGAYGGLAGSSGYGTAQYTFVVEVSEVVPIL